MRKPYRLAAILVPLVCLSIFSGYGPISSSEQPKDFEIWGKEFEPVKDHQYSVEKIAATDGIEPWGSLAERSIYGIFDPSLFYYSGELNYFSEKPLKMLDGKTLAPRNGGDVFGVGFKWIKPLDPGYEYEFHLAFVDLPDFISIGDNVVWDAASGYIKFNGKASPPFEVIFHYTPRSHGDVMIWCVRDKKQYGKDEAIIMSDNPQFWCSRRAARSTAPVVYRQFKPPYQVKKTKKLFTYFDQEHRVPLARWNKPAIRKPGYPTENIIVLNYALHVKDNTPTEPAFLGCTNVPYGMPYELLNLLADNGIHGMMLWGYILPENPEINKIQDEQVIKRGLNTFYVNVYGEGRWLDTNPAFHNWGYGKKPAKIEDLQQWRTVNYLLDNFPEAKVMLLIGGELENVQSLTYSKAQNKFEVIHKTYIQQHADWVKMLKQNVHQPERVITAEQPLGCAYPIGYLLKSYDTSMTKTWGRQSVEINIATNRGACRSYGRQMMMADDPWFGGIWCTRSPEEMEQLFYLSYFSGIDYLYHEYLGYVQKGSEIFPNKWGKVELDFGRFTTVHPKRGNQLVKLAVVRGFGDNWSIIQVRGFGDQWSPTDNHYTDKNMRTGDDIADYTLLNAFFPGFGDCNQTNVYRFCTGTPFGPVDMISWDTSLDHMKTYDVVAYFGLNAMDDQQYRTLKEYVTQGGKLVISLGQLKTEGKDPREILPAALDDGFLGVRLDRFPRMLEGKTGILFRQQSGTVNGLYELTPTTGEVIAKTVDGRPVVIRNGYGKGEVYLYATDFISKVDDESNIRFLSGLAKPARLLDIAPESDWIEYTMWQKGRAYIIPIFNHGRIRFPCGNGPDHGIWKGRITLDFDKFPGLRDTELEAYRVTFQDPKIRLTPVRIAKDKNGASIKLAVDKRVELVVGPKAWPRRSSSMADIRIVGNLLHNLLLA